MPIITVIGGTGVFGRRIAEDLATVHDVAVRVVGRDDTIGRALAESIGADFRRAHIDDDAQLRRAIDGSQIVIHTAGPFQASDDRVAEKCIEIGSHYIDIADARRFVIDISRLDGDASKRGVFITSGASSVPAVTFALCSELKTHFRTIDSIQIALSPGNQNPRGASTIGAILSYIGRPIRVKLRGRWIDRTGWGDAMRLAFPPPVGRRRVYNCDVPDLELFPGAFNSQTVRFHAGVELNIINRALSTIAAVRRLVPMPNLHRLAPPLLRASMLLYRFGSKNGSLSVWMRGVDAGSRPIERRIAVVTDDDGPATPSAPAIILAKKIIAGGPVCAGASPCMGFITLNELESHLHRFGVWIARGDEHGWHDRAA